MLVKLQASVAMGLSASDGWAFADFGEASRIFEQAIDAAGLNEIAAEFGRAAEGFSAAFDTSGLVTIGEADTRAISAALQAKYDGWGNELGDLTDWLHDRLVTQSITAVPTSELITEALGYIQGEFQDHANTYVETAIHNQLRATWGIIGRNGGDDVTYHYEGPDDGKTREFCADLLEKGEEYTEAEIHDMDNDQDMDAFEAGGGWNCRHVWIPTFLKVEADTEASAEEEEA